MTRSNREGRHLERQRGAGARPIVPSFGFTFSAAAKAALANRTAAAKPASPVKKTPAKRRKSVNYKPTTQRARLAGGSSATPEVKQAQRPAATAPRSTTKRTASAKKPLPALPTEDDLPGPVKSPVRKAKFYEHLSDSEPPAQTKLKKPKKTTKRKRKPVTMPKSRKTKAKRAPSDDLPVDPADVVDESEPEQEIRTQRGSVKRRHGDAPREAEEAGYLAKRAKLQSQQESRHKTPLQSAQAQREPQQLPSPIESGRDNSIKTPPKSGWQKFRDKASKAFRRDETLPAGSKDSPLNASADDTSSTHSTGNNLYMIRSAGQEPTLKPPPHGSNPARMKTAPPDELIRSNSMQEPTAVTPTSLEEPKINRTITRPSPHKPERPSKIMKTNRKVVVKTEDDGDSTWFTRRGRKGK
ncbi:hypothetical protein B9Z65_3434 [Elsinoe australis]|uniref:Uncharacterized protein n=1 Tax=Elsinoe australis TaxID=40998 RepID=A0A2P8A1H6_9PEZI|nr:hypothetical protein B9Z65_3434 [Elsinoe australis]